MAGDDLAAVRSAAAAVLFLQAGMYTLDSYSTLLSSPWTAESFGGDPGKTRALRQYLTHAAVYSTAYCAASAAIAPRGLRFWPLAGAVVNNAYLVFLYTRATRRAQAAGSASWAAPGGIVTPAARLAWDTPA